MEATKTNKRIKRVFSCREVPHLWANQTQDSARDSRQTIYFEGEIIYSYGYHFPIARIYTDKKGVKTVFFTTRGYSNSTSKHKSMVWRACSHLPSIQMANVILDPKPLFGKIDNNHQKNIKYYINEITDLITKFSKARCNKRYIYREMCTQLRELEDYITFFKIKSKIDSHTKKLIERVKSSEWEESINAYKAREKERLNDPKLEEKREKARIAREKAKQKQYEEQIRKWRSFEASSPYLDNYYWLTRASLLRFNTDKQRVETSKSVQIPIEIAHKFYRYIKIVLAKGGCYNTDSCSYKLLDVYDVNKISPQEIVVGCHTILMEEVELIATQLKWNEHEENKESVSGVSE